MFFEKATSLDLLDPISKRYNICTIYKDCETMKRNEMMDMPVIKHEVRDYLRNMLPTLTGEISEIQESAAERRVPVIPHETVVFFKWLLPLLQPKEILEIGTAIGFSASLIAQSAGKEAKVTTIERNPTMIEEARVNIKKMNLENRITILEGQAEDHLKELDTSFDFIFMDSAKAKYYDFFPDCMRLLKVGGVLAVDDVLQGGTIVEPIENIPKRRRTIHKKLNLFLDAIVDCPFIELSIVPLGDGLLLITKREDKDFEKWLADYMEAKDA